MKIKTKNWHLAVFIAETYTKIFHRDSRISHDGDIKKLYDPKEILNNWYYIIELK
jgi:hypothetical protein